MRGQGREKIHHFLTSSLYLVPFPYITYSTWQLGELVCCSLILTKRQLPVLALTNETPALQAGSCQILTALPPNLSNPIPHCHQNNPTLFFIFFFFFLNSGFAIQVASITQWNCNPILLLQGLRPQHCRNSFSPTDWIIFQSVQRILQIRAGYSRNSASRCILWIKYDSFFALN